ncbi:glutamate decarboxylase alpha [Chlorella sorokiniana]|uniref:Glutamate decarboxylase alpha n=1 Tax=Chlorella sorokiniana TaxID=3076 RepID=A0A2P6TF12_CHLSO|nr:glutamate decarboxylase alpha [Chlorella sorokiniana]|eukprot:PRW32559.1 glutamate decarboxylase alpha [Chlorella sorokiniana]
MSAMEVPGGAVRSRYGVICLTPGHKKVALVRLADTGAWQFPSLLPAREGTVELEDQLETALDVAQEQLGLDVTACLCSQPVIHALGPEARASTKFFMAFNVPEVTLVPAEGALGAQGAEAASWEDLQSLLEETADQPVAGNQLVAVLRQLQGMIKRRFEMVMPADDGYQEVASLLSWHEEEVANKWRGLAPKEFLEAHCKAHKLPAPCFNVFERDRSATRTHFCATCMLPHLGLQLTPDAVYTSPVDAMQNSAALAVLYLEGALPPDCPLVTFAPAGEMAQVPHAFVTEREARLDARVKQDDSDRQKAEMERRVLEEQAALERRMDELRRQQAALASGRGIPGLGPNAVPTAPPAKRPRPDKQPLTLTQALSQIPADKNPLMALKEICDKCRFAMPDYHESEGPGGTVVAITMPQANVQRVTGPPHADKRQAKTLAAQAVVTQLRERFGVAPAPAAG